MHKRIVRCSIFLVFAFFAGLAGLVPAQPAPADSAALAAQLKVSGQPLAEAEARQLAEKLDARVFLPGKNWFTVQCEFAPRFTQLEPTQNPDLVRKAAHN